MDWNMWVGLGIILASIFIGLYRSFFLSYRDCEDWFDIEEEEERSVGVSEIGLELPGAPKKKRCKKKPKSWYRKYRREIILLIIGTVISQFGDIIKQVIVKWLGV